MMPQKWGLTANFLIRDPVEIISTLHRISITATGNYEGIPLKAGMTNDTSNNFNYIGKSVNDNRTKREKNIYGI
jgi:hypothetical protein